MSKVHFIRTSVIAALVLGAACRGAASQESEKAYFEGKTVRIVVGYAPGGGYDVYARMIAPYLKKYLDATVVVENKPGAGGITALNGLYASPPDGLRIMLVKGNAATMAQLTEQKGVRYDLRAFNILGGTGLSPDVMVVGAGSSIKSVEDLRTQKRTILWAATGPMDGL